MSKVVNDVVKAFGSSIEDATRKLQMKFKGFCVLHPEFQSANLEYDAGLFNKDGKEMAWAKLYQLVEEAEPAEENHPKMKETTKKSGKRKAKVA